MLTSCDSFGSCAPDVEGLWCPGTPAAPTSFQDLRARTRIRVVGQPRPPRRARQGQLLRPANGLKAWQQVLDRGYEGLVGKDESAPYRGGRSLSWLTQDPR